MNEDMDSILKFSTIDLDLHSDLCVSFRRDAFLCSFHDGERLFEVENGEKGSLYIEWLKERIAEFPQGCVHAFLEDQIVGQLEMRLRSAELGYVNLFYLIPRYRGTSLGAQLHAYLTSTMSGRGVQQLQLTVSTQNKRAIRFYEKNGWRALRYRDAEKKHLLMELQLSVA
jgi:GNAT superfamily N-acetyltransferase